MLLFTSLFLILMILLEDSFSVKLEIVNLSPKSTRTLSPRSIVESYFKYWNVRDMDKAIDLFAEDCTYEDTLFPDTFIGKASVKSHLYNVASSVPDSFRFVLDDVSEDLATGKVGVQWHVESGDQKLPFTRGCSFYSINTEKGLIQSGFDVPEPTIKSGIISLSILKSASSIIEEPRRAIPWLGWVFYCWLLFFSTIAPGLNALSLDPNTWLEVKDLSLNFWLVLPILAPSSAPVLHPGLEGIFNLLLAWSALFAGFNIDNRLQKVKGGPNISQALVWMQFLTNAIYLPYLATRYTYKRSETASTTAVNYSDLSPIERACESKLFPIFFGAVGIAAIAWGAFGRETDFSSLESRFTSLFDLISSDRLSFSFVVDLLYFAIFQSWLIDDDMKIRDESQSADSGRRAVFLGKNVPFFGLVYYLIARPPLILK